MALLCMAFNWAQAKKNWRKMVSIGGDGVSEMGRRNHKVDRIDINVSYSEQNHCYYLLLKRYQFCKILITNK